LAKDVKSVANELCNSGDQMRYVLTALATAVQERLGEDVILCPREEENAPMEANVLSLRFNCKNQTLWRHYVYYGIPRGDPHAAEELLCITLDVAHELGHLILDRGPGRMNKRVGISKRDLEDVREIEADWFALCALQMYGFICAPEEKSEH